MTGHFLEEKRTIEGDNITQNQSLKDWVTLQQKLAPHCKSITLKKKKLTPPKKRKKKKCPEGGMCPTTSRSHLSLTTREGRTRPQPVLSEGCFVNRPAAGGSVGQVPGQKMWTRPRPYHWSWFTRPHSVRSEHLDSTHLSMWGQNFTKVFIFSLQKNSEVLPSPPHNKVILISKQVIYF